METIKMTVQERILELIESRGWSKYKLAKEIGVYPTTVYDWFNEKHITPSGDSIDGICTVFGITRAQFYSKVDENKLSEDQLSCIGIIFKNSSKQKKNCFRSYAWFI